MMRSNPKLWRGVVLGTGLMLALAATASVGSAQDAPKRHPGIRQGSTFSLGASTTYLLNFNEWLCGLHQIGEVCTSAVGSSVGGGGFWPAGTANQYIFNSGLQMAGIIGPEGGAWAGDTVSTFFFNASGPGHGSPLSPVFASNNPADVAAWPEACFIDSPAFGRVKTLSELDTCVQYWDADPTATFPGSHPMGIKVTQHSLMWSFPSNKDIIFFIYRFENASNDPQFRARNPSVPAGGYTLTDLYAAFAMDPDVSGSEYSQNFATVVPELNMAMAWQYDFEAADFVAYAPNFDAAPGFVGVKYLKSPVNTADTALTVTVGESTRTVEPGEELGLTFFSVFTNPGSAAPMPDADNAKQAFRYLSGNLLDRERQDWCPAAPAGMCYVDLAGPADMRFYQSSGPFSLAPGESAEIVVAYVAGAPVPGTYTKGEVIPVGDVTNTSRQIEQVMGRGFERPGFPSLFGNARTAQAIFDGDFVLPGAPPGPQVTVIPGDNQNTVVWTAEPVTAVDPYSALANDPESDLFDPNFRANDFEGFRVYRKSNPAADWQLIGQFDLRNALSEQVTVLEEVETASGDILVINADTARVCPANAAGCVPETGLKFAIVDRGGDFPNPAAGNGLVNGVRYYYAVTSFDINSPFSGPSTLEGARVLSADASGVPRSTAGGKSPFTVTAATLFAGDGSVLDPTDTVTIDPATGTFSGPQPPTNALELTFNAFDELLVTPGTFGVTIDSIKTYNGYQAEQTVFNSLGVSIRYFMTVETPDGTVQVSPEVPAPFGFYGAPEEIEVPVASEFFQANPARAAELGIPGDHLASEFAARLVYGPDVANSGSEAVGVFRAHASFGGVPLSEDNGSRWFVGTPPAHPAEGTQAGELPGVSQILNLAQQYGLNANLRWLVYTLSPTMRATDYEVTWGANGTIERVFDVAHKVEVPFDEEYEATWGVRNEASGDGILSFADFWFSEPVAQWYCEELGCHVPLERAAVIQPLSEVPPSGWGATAAEATGQGFGLYISGELFLFETDQLPPAGTVWTLRTYNGNVYRDDDGLYQFVLGDRPPTVPGLRAEITVEAAATFAAAEADLTKVHTVPDPYLVTNRLESSPIEKRLQFVNLPTNAVVRIFTLSGVLVAALDHDDPTGGGTLEWDLRNRNNQFVASGVYFYHVETPEGREKIGKFTVVQFAQ